MDPFFENLPAKKEHRDIIVGNAVRTAPRQIAFARREHFAVYPPAPNTGAAVAAKRVKRRDQCLCWGNNMVGPAIETAQVPFDRGAEPAEAVIFQVCLEKRMHARKDWNILANCPRLRSDTQEIWRRNMDDIRIKPLQIIAHTARQA